MGKPQKIVVVGAGPVGSLAALYAAQRGHQVEVYELRPDLRDPGTIPLNFTRSINLAISERGINAMRYAGQSQLLEHVMATTIPMQGRMIHGRGPTGALFEQSQSYDVKGRAIHAVDRAGLNKRLLDILESMPNAKLFFNHKLTGADFRSCKAWFEVQGNDSPKDSRFKEIDISFDLMMGADGAHSAVRYHLMKFTQMNYQQEYIDTLWCEFKIDALQTDATDDPLAKFRISPNHLHIWPGKDFMFIAIPSENGSFTCTLFLPSEQMAELGNNPPSLPAFFDKHFPGVTNLISNDDLISSFEASPHLPLISLKCKPYHYGSSCVIIGDAAHAMVPFYGQGMNAGMEDVRILFSILDKYDHMDETNDPSSDCTVSTAPSFQRGLALAEYSAVRPIDAHAINDLALQNYVEMRSSVLSTRYRLRKYLEELMSVYLPSLGWQTKYARVSFSNEGYFDVIQKSDAQGKTLVRSFFALLASPFIITAAVAGYRYQRTIMNIVRALISPDLRRIQSIDGSTRSDLLTLSFDQSAPVLGTHTSSAMPSILNISNMCSHLQNASKARLGITSVKNCKFNLHLALAMHRSGFFSNVYRGGPTPPTMEDMVSKVPDRVTNINVATRRLWLGLKYWDGKPVLTKAHAISKPKRLITANIEELGRLTRGFPTTVKGGVIPGLNLGECMFVATSRGVLEAREALDRKTGGVLMCRVS
ncbi:hypothetical protein G7046_g882 [Stylonectria norvegica]|nr:hypothetical protein G7046_g882 [Stylonectria norvegica]